MRTVVTGAAGAIGSRVARELAAGGTPVTGIVRRVGAAPAVAGLHEAVAPYDDPHALARAFDDAQTLIFVGSDREADAMLVHHHNIVTAAAASGVERVVLLSSQDADPKSPFCYARTYALTEAWVNALCPNATIVRAGLYAEFFGRWVQEAAQAGRMTLPMTSSKVAPVARSDVAAALVACATGQHPAMVYTVTGPESFDLRSLAKVAEALAGAPVPATTCSAEDFARALVAVKPDPWWRYAYSTMFLAIADGRFGACTDDLFTLTGSRGIAFQDALDTMVRTMTVMSHEPV